MRISALILILVAFSSTAWTKDYRPQILSALKHLEQTQATQRGSFEPGEWPTYVSAILLPSLIGVGSWGKPYPEATVFTTATIVSVLRDIYEENPQLDLIPPMLDRAIDGFAPYYQEPFFNFYPPKKHKGVWVRGPRNLYIARYLRGLAHIPSDADSTSVAYLALGTPVPEEVISAFSRFRDVKRKPHYYNRHLGIVNSGAFMTWLMDEKDPEMPKRLNRPELGPRIPFGRNDVDCIVNANVLKLLTLHNRHEVKGYKESCSLLKKAVEQNQYGTCGIYYPSDYLLALRVGELKELGATCLGDRYVDVLRYLIVSQGADGSWVNAPPNRPDAIHSTAVALNSLLLLGDPKNVYHRERVQRAVNYLLKHALKDDQGYLFWRGQVFFSAVAQARYSVVWRSSAYTTALVAKALQGAEKF